MTNGYSNYSEIAPNNIDIDKFKFPVIQLWYKDGNFINKDNKNHYEMLHSYLNSLF